MAANFNLPTVSTTYTAFPTQIIENIDAALQMLSVGSPSNVPTGAIKWDASLNRFRKYNGSAYVDLTGTYNLNAALSVTRLDLGDGDVIRLGNSQDFQLFHRASDSVSILQESGGGYLSLQSNGSRIEMYDSANGRNMAEFNIGGACTFNHGATTRIATSGVGATVTGVLTTTGSTTQQGTELQLDGSSGGQRRIKVGSGRTDNAYSFIDFVGDATYTTYGLRLIRNNTGPNTSSALQHRGTGTLNITAIDAGEVSLATNSIGRLRVTSGGPVGVGLTNPTHRLQVYANTQFACKIESTSSGANLDLKDNDTISQFRTIDGRLHIATDTANSVADSQIRFNIDNTNKVLIDHNGGVGIGTGTAAPNRKLEISSSDQTSIIRLANTDTTIADGDRIGRLEFHGSDAGASGNASFIEAVANGTGGAADLRFGIGVAGSAFEAARFDSSGRLLIGSSTNVNSRVGTSNFQPTLQIHSNNEAAMSISRYQNGTASSRLHLQKGRGTKTSPANIASNDDLGEITFSGYHGSNFRNGARIRARCASASNSMPSDLIFEVTNDSGSFNDNLVITHDRFVGIIKSGPTVPLHVKQLADNAGVFRLEDSGSANQYLTVDVTDEVTSFTGRGQGNFGVIRFRRHNGTSNIETLRIHADSAVTIGQTTSEANARLTVNGGNIVSSGSISSGFAGTGQASLSVNDGGGNCNVCFNHKAQTPDNAGVSGRIVVNTDSASGANNVAGMDFQLNENVSAGSVQTTTSAFSIHRGRASQLDGSGNTVYSQVRIPDGANDGSVVGLAFTDDIDTGIVRTGGNALGISCGNDLTFETSAAHGTRVAGELNLQGNTTESAKFIDIGFEGYAFQMRRTKFDDTGHDYFLQVSAAGIFSTRSDIGSTSDVKLKKNITTIADGAIENIKKLRPVKFDWIKENLTNNNNGFIAQELKEVFPNLVYGTEYDPTLNDPEKGTKGGIKSEGYSIGLVGIVANITKALQEAIAKIESLETEVAALKSA